MSEEAKRLLMTYTVLNSDYSNAKLRRIEGLSGGPNAVDYPTDTGYDVHEASDPMVYSYLSTNDEVHLLVVRTQAGSPQATTYTVLRQGTNGWEVYKNTNNNKRENIKFTLDGTAVLGNPQSLAQVKSVSTAGGTTTTNRFIYLVDFDSAWVYGINVADFEDDSGTTYPLNLNLCKDLTATVDPPNDAYTAHGVSIIALQDSNNSHSLFALYMSVDNPWADTPFYAQSPLVKLSVDSNGALTEVDDVPVGLNATGLVPVVDSASNTFILVPAIGGKQNYGYNNDYFSNLSVVPTSLASAPVALVGAAGFEDDDNEWTYDIRMAATSADGAYIYILTGTYGLDYNMFWRLYKFTLAELQSYNQRSLADAAIKAHAIDSGTRDLGYYWSVLFETSAGTAGRLWFVKGSPIQITVGTDYASANKKLIRIGDDELGGTNVNSVDLTGEMVALAKTDKSVSTIFRAYQPPHVVSGAFRSMADFIRHEKVKKLHKERLEKKQAKGRGKQGASKDAAHKAVTHAPKVTVSMDPKVLATKIDVTLSFDPKDASPKIEVKAAK
jgi:hypothetical protein